MLSFEIFQGPLILDRLEWCQVWKSENVFVLELHQFSVLMECRVLLDKI